MCNKNLRLKSPFKVNQGPIGTIIIFRQCVRQCVRQFFVKPFDTIKKPLFCDIPQIWFFSFF